MKDDETEHILCSAIWFKPKNIDGGFVVCGLRHSNCFSVVKNLFPDISKFKEKYKEVAQGFVTSDNRFIDRIEAVGVAFQSGQIKERDNRMKLFSEDLW